MDDHLKNNALDRIFKMPLGLRITVNPVELQLPIGGHRLCAGEAGAVQGVVWASCLEPFPSESQVSSWGDISTTQALSHASPFLQTGTNTPIKFHTRK